MRSVCLRKAFDDFEIKKNLSLSQFVLLGLGCSLRFSFVVVIVSRTIVPRRNLGPRMDCSHMIVPLGARWYLSTCGYELLQLSFHATFKIFFLYLVFYKG